jgi:tetratricopeptide (TPR) repeat protein
MRLMAIRQRRAQGSHGQLKSTVEPPRGTFTPYELPPIYARMESAAEPIPLWWRQEGDRRRCNADAAGALLAYTRSVALDPFPYAGWLGMGLSFEALERQEDALKYYDIATSLGPHSFAAYESKGLLLHKRGAFEQALTCFEWLALIADGSAVTAAWAMNYTAATLIRLGRAAEAIASCDRGLGLQPMDVLWLTRGNALRDLGLFDAAIVSHNQALALNPKCGEARFNRALVEEDQGRTQAAIRTYRQCLEMNELDSALERRVRRRLAEAAAVAPSRP